MSDERSATRPNILFITCHDLGRHLGCYGHPTLHTPALDALAATGLRFEQAFCTAPQCSPSRAALHTGQYPHASGVLGLAHPPFGWRLTPVQHHLAHLLAANGYARVLIGMQHVIATGEAAELGYERLLPVRPAPDEAQAAVELLRELAAADRPFYLEVGFEEPHRPYDFGGATPDSSGGVELLPYLPPLEEARADLAAFAGAVRVMDGAVGVVLAALDELGLRDNTWVLFVTDHGIAMPRAKGTLYDPGIGIALLMRWPQAGLRGGAVCRELFSNVDVTPTILDALHLPMPDWIQGKSFWTRLREVAGGSAPATPLREMVFAEKTFHTYYEPMRAIRTATHKYIANFEISSAVDVPVDVQQSPYYPALLPMFGPARPHVELYDLAADPWEQTNRAGQHEMAATEADLRAHLLAWMRETADPLLDGPVASPYYYETLRRLGV